MIERDGFCYHDRTPEPFYRKRQRERELCKLGLRVYRFSADELFKDPWGAGLDVISALGYWPTCVPSCCGPCCKKTCPGGGRT